jgi:hypothetical protein
VLRLARCSGDSVLKQRPGTKAYTYAECEEVGYEDCPEDVLRLAALDSRAYLLIGVAAILWALLQRWLWRIHFLERF